MPEPNLRDYMTVLRRRRWVVITSVLVAVGVAVAISLLQKPQYRAETELLLRRTLSEDLLVDEIGEVRTAADSARELNNEIRLIESRVTRDAVDSRYDGPLDVDDVKAVAPASEQDDVLDISIVSTDPAAAAELVNLYAETYITERQDRQLEDLGAASDQIQSRLDEVRRQISEARQPLDAIDVQILATRVGSQERNELEEQRQTIMTEVSPTLAPLQNRESSLVGQLEQLEVTQDLARAGGIDVLAPAEEPESPVSPNTVGNIVVGGLIGLLGGVGLAFARDYLDDSVRSKQDSERLTGLPTLALIPKVPLRRGSSTTLVTLDQPTSAAAEAFRSLRTSVKFLGVDEDIRTVLVTSPAASEGKTQTAANLAVALVQAGERVLLVGGDLRRPRVHELFGAPMAPGLTSVLLGNAPADAAVYDVSELPGLHLLTSGPVPPNPSELLGGERARAALRELAGSYDTVVIDSPPVLEVTDAQVLARLADTTLVVVAYGETSKRGLTRTLELLQQVDAPVSGTVLNLVPLDMGYSGAPYRYETYRSRRERRLRHERRDPASSSRDHGEGTLGQLAATPNDDGMAQTPTGPDWPVERADSSPASRHDDADQRSWPSRARDGGDHPGDLSSPSANPEQPDDDVPSPDDVSAIRPDADGATDDAHDNIR
jgi:capsular exopolysaccharide synthesis family protein